jgi:hypothetical protein
VPKEEGDVETLRRAICKHQIEKSNLPTDEITTITQVFSSQEPFFPPRSISPGALGIIILQAPSGAQAQLTALLAIP